MFYFRINKLKIFDNREGKKFPLFGRDLAQVKLISFINTEGVQMPDLSDFIQTNDAEEKKTMLTAAVESVISSRILTEIDNVKDGHVMTFGDAGYVLYQSEQIPKCFDWNFIAYESDKNVRDNGALLEDIINDSSFNSFSKSLGSLLQKASNPAFSAYNEIAKYALSIIGKAAKKNKDDLIGILYMSLNRIEHYPHGERKRDDVPDLTNNMLLDYTIFGFE